MMQDFIDFAEAALAARQFEAIAQRHAELPDQTAREPVVLAWVARAQAELGAFGKARLNAAVAMSMAGDVPEWTKWVLHQATWMDHAPFEEDVPALLRASLDEFGTFVTRLIEHADLSAPLPDPRFTAATLAMYWLKTGIRTITLSDRSESTEADLAAAGFAPAFIDAAFNGGAGIVALCTSLSTDVHFARQRHMSPRLFDVASAVLLRGKPVLCPFTGGRGLTRDSIDMFVYRYQHDGRTCLTIGDDTMARAGSDCAWFLPAQRLLVTIPGWTSLPMILARALTRAFENNQAVARYLAQTTPRPVMVADITVGHIGHYVWNAISGWPRLLSLVPPEMIDIVATNTRHQIFGGVKELYPDYRTRVGQMIEVEGEHIAYQIMLDRGALGLTLVDRHVTSDLAGRVKAWCRDQCTPNFLATVDEFRSAIRPMLLVTIRLDNRAWVEQETGLPRIINRLAEDFPGLGVVLDGLNAGINSLDTHAFMSMDEEQRVAQHIIDACPRVRIQNTIGCTPAEGIVWCDAVDAFLAPVGAGMAKYRWITNKPGVAYSNETCLTPNSYDGSLYERHRADLVPMEYVAREGVRDVEQRHGMLFRANFSMQWIVAYFKIFGMLTGMFPDARRKGQTVQIYPVEENAGLWSVRFDSDITLPLVLAGKPITEFTDGWRPKFVFAGFAPIFLLELANDDGSVATWFLDESMSRISGSVNDLPEKARLDLVIRQQAGLLDRDGFSQVNLRTAGAIRSLTQKAPQATA